MDSHAGETSQKVQALADRFGIRLILRFGSSVTGRTHALSDQDIAVRFRVGVPEPGELADLALALQELFPGPEVDLAVINRADPLFLKKILESAELLFGTTRELAELKTYAFRRYVDHRPYLAMERAYVQRALEDGLHSHRPEGV